MGAQQLGQAGFVEGHLAAGQALDLGRVHVHAEDLEAQLGHAGGVRGAQIARADHGQPRRGLLLGGGGGRGRLGHGGLLGGAGAAVGDLADARPRG